MLDIQILFLHSHLAAFLCEYSHLFSFLPYGSNLLPKTENKLTKEKAEYRARAPYPRRYAQATAFVKAVQNDSYYLTHARVRAYAYMRAIYK